VPTDHNFSYLLHNTPSKIDPMAAEYWFVAIFFLNSSLDATTAFTTAHTQEKLPENGKCKKNGTPWSLLEKALE
jgi:hypothetical protein